MKDFEKALPSGLPVDQAPPGIRNTAEWSMISSSVTTAHGASSSWKWKAAPAPTGPVEGRGREDPGAKVTQRLFYWCTAPTAPPPAAITSPVMHSALGEARYAVSQASSSAATTLRMATP